MYSLNQLNPNGWNIMKFLNSDNVVCIGAHPDDVEYGMAGTFSRCSDTNFFVIVMSSGGDFDKTTQTSNRKKENTDIWNLFNDIIFNDNI